jgi:hypothetical protein
MNNYLAACRMQDAERITGVEHVKGSAGVPEMHEGRWNADSVAMCFGTM